MKNNETITVPKPITKPVPITEPKPNDDPWDIPTPKENPTPKAKRDDMKYNVDYFIKKFKKIPSNKWTEIFVCDDVSGRKDALGHCGVKTSDDGTAVIQMNSEAMALIDLMKELYPTLPRNSVVNHINDGNLLPYKKMKNPKERIISALKMYKTLMN